jgi:hypothetical protein
MVVRVLVKRLRVEVSETGSKLVVQTRKMLRTMLSVRVKRSAERMLICSEARAQESFSRRRGLSREARVSVVYPLSGWSVHLTQ